ncbi:MAG: choice-of-anchor tandem repeat GloVer-containing protein [Terracidiphilus sp.]
MKNSSNSQWGRTCRLAYVVALPLLLCLAESAGVQAQTLTTLHNFNGTDGAFPSSQLTSQLAKSHVVQHSNGNFYGTTPAGGAFTYGTVFQVTAAGAETTIYSFCSLGGSACTDGSTPQGALVLGSNGNLYGTTFSGGANNDGTVFVITPAGSLTTLHSFSGADGANPVGALALGRNGNLYGTTFVGGANNDGTVFQITPGGSLTTLHTFSGADGINPGGDLVLSSGNGNFYGTTYAGGNSNSAGTLFQMTPSGSLTTLYTFCSSTNCNDGSAPNVPLTLDSFGDVYGTTSTNGANAGGTLFELTWWGGFHTIYHFCAKTNCTDGAQPLGGPVVGKDFNIYGTTTTGGAGGSGTVYQFTPWHQLTTLYNFCSKANCTDGANPETALTQGADGNFYGTTSVGGTFNFGTVWNLATVPASGHSCNGVYSANFLGNIYVSSGQTCEFTDGATILGNVYLSGGSLILTNATVLGNVEIQGGTYALGPSLTIASKLEVQNVPSGTTQNTVCGVNVFGSVYYNGNGSPAEIGSSSSSCPGNTIGGDLEINSNTAFVQVFDNSVRDALTCSSNSNITGASNTARRKPGQCSSF